MIQLALIALSLGSPLWADQVSLQAIVTPSTTILKDSRPVTFAIHGFIEFRSLAELFPYVEAQTRRWKVDNPLDNTGKGIAQELLRRGIEGRVVSMVDERPLESESRGGVSLKAATATIVDLRSRQRQCRRTCAYRAAVSADGRRAGHPAHRPRQH